MKVIGWRIWYADGTSISSRESSWEDAPDDGVLFVMVYRDGGYRMTMLGNDWYFRAPDIHGFGMIYGHQNGDTKAEILRRYPGAVIKRGKWVSDEHMEKVNAEALAAVW